MATGNASESDMNITAIVIAISESPVFGDLIRKWYKLAMTLDTKDTYKDQLNHKLLHETLQPEQLMVDLLTDWKQKFGKMATMAELHKILKLCEFNAIADLLKEKFAAEIGTKEDDENEGLNLFMKQNRDLYDHFMYYMVDLLERTHLSDELLDKLERENILQKNDVEILKEMYDREDQNRTFYRFIMERLPEKPGVYDALIDFFIEDERNYKDGVSGLLNKYYD